MQVQAPAKINLTLRVLGKRPDGYHELESVMQLLTLADVLTIEHAEELRFTCSEPVLEGEDNLVMRAARLLHTRCSRAHGAHIHLEKHIPAQAGLGGGSSDAATTLAALNEFWEVRLTQDELMALGAELGSDVPFFLNGPAAVVRGRGEKVTHISHNLTAHLVIAKPSAGLSTPAVYEQLHAHPFTPTPHDDLATIRMRTALLQGDLPGVVSALVNDLEGPALVMLPELMRLRERMLQEGCLAVLLCGSGSAVFGICPSAEVACHAAKNLTNDCPWTWAGAWQPTR